MYPIVLSKVINIKNFHFMNLGRLVGHIEWTLFFFGVNAWTKGSFFFLKDLMSPINSALLEKEAEIIVLYMEVVEQKDPCDI